MPPGAGVVAAQRLPLEGGDFSVDWLLLVIVCVLGCMLLCLVCFLWQKKRRNLAYEYLEMEREKNLEEAKAAVDYGAMRSEMSGEEASLQLRLANIELSGEVESTHASESTGSESTMPGCS